MKNSWIVLDGLTSLTPEIARGLATAGALSLRGVKKLDTDTARELANHGCQLLLTGVEEASDDAIGALAETKADLFLDSLAEISEHALEKLIRFPGKQLRLGLKQLDDKRAHIIELYHGDELHLNSVCELSDRAAASLSRLKCFLGLSSVRNFSESACRHLAAFGGEWTLSGGLQLSQKGFETLFSGGNLSSWLRLRGPIELPEYAYEIIYTTRVINKRLAEMWLLDAERSYNPIEEAGQKGILTAAGAELIVARSPIGLSLFLEKLSDEVAEILSRHTGELFVEVDGLTAEAAASLAKRQYFKKKESSLSVGSESLEPSQAAALAETLCPLKLIRLRHLSDKAAEVLALNKGDLWLGPDNPVYDPSVGWIEPWQVKLSPKAVKALAKKKGAINGMKADQWAKSRSSKRK
jgi:hypothetical protein